MVRFCVSVQWPGALDFDALTSPREMGATIERGVQLMGAHGASFVVVRLSSLRGLRAGLHLLPVWGRGVEPPSSCYLRHAWPRGGAQPDALHACGDADCEGESEWVPHVRIDPPGVYAYSIDCDNDAHEAEEGYLVLASLVLAREGRGVDADSARELLSRRDDVVPGAVYAQRARGEGGRE